MTLQQISLLGLEAAGWLFVLLFIGVALLRAREERLKYKLYSLRDDLLYLVACGKLSQESLLFKAFYTALTESIIRIRSLTVYSFLQASVSARTAIQKEKVEHLSAEIEKSPREVRAFVNRFAGVMMAITLANSPVLRFILFSVDRCGRLFRHIRRWIDMPHTYEAYHTYRYFERIHSLAHA